MVAKYHRHPPRVHRPRDDFPRWRRLVGRTAIGHRWVMGVQSDAPESVEV